MGIWKDVMERRGLAMGSLTGNVLYLAFTLALVLGSKSLMYGRRCGLCQGGCPMGFVSVFSQAALHSALARLWLSAMFMGLYNTVISLNT